MKGISQKVIKIILDSGPKKSEKWFSICDTFWDHNNTSLSAKELEKMLNHLAHLIIGQKSRKMLDHLWYLFGSKSHLIIGQKFGGNYKYYKRVLFRMGRGGGLEQL